MLQQHSIYSSPPFCEAVRTAGPGLFSSPRKEDTRRLLLLLLLLLVNRAVQLLAARDQGAEGEAGQLLLPQPKQGGYEGSCGRAARVCGLWAVG